jgi:hypothetical protein
LKLNDSLAPEPRTLYCKTRTVTWAEVFAGIHASDDNYNGKHLLVLSENLMKNFYFAIDVSANGDFTDMDASVCQEMISMLLKPVLDFCPLLGPDNHPLCLDNKAYLYKVAVEECLEISKSYFERIKKIQDADRKLCQDSRNGDQSLLELTFSVKNTHSAVMYCSPLAKRADVYAKLHDSFRYMRGEMIYMNSTKKKGEYYVGSVPTGRADLAQSECTLSVWHALLALLDEPVFESE